MTRLLRAGTITGTPVVTLGGESSLEVKDVVFGAESGAILGFTLRRHGFLGGPVAEVLAWGDVHGLGPDAVIVADDGALSDPGGLAGDRGDVLGAEVLTESGSVVGEVVEVIVRVGSDDADVVGFEIEPGGDLGADAERHAFLPLPDALAVSGPRVIVPDGAVSYVRDDLAGFGAAVDEFRERLGGGS